MTTPIKGYRKPSEDEIAQINAIKEAAEFVRMLVDAVMKDPSTDKRWGAIARTELQQGFMALTRAIAQPETF